MSNQTIIVFPVLEVTLGMVNEGRAIGRAKEILAPPAGVTVAAHPCLNRGVYIINAAGRGAKTYLRNLAKAIHCEQKDALDCWTTANA